MTIKSSRQGIEGDSYFLMKKFTEILGESETLLAINLAKIQTGERVGEEEKPFNILDD